MSLNERKDTTGKIKEVDLHLHEHEKQVTKAKAHLDSAAQREPNERAAPSLLCPPLSARAPR